MKKISTIIFLFLFSFSTMGQVFLPDELREVPEGSAYLPPMVNTISCLNPYLFNKNRNSLRTSATSGIKQRLDSVISEYFGDWDSQWYLSDKLEYVYDEFGKVILTSEYQWNVGDEKWDLRRKAEAVFENNKLIRNNHYSTNGDTLDWWLSKKEEFGYNEAGNLGSSILYYWNDWDSSWLASTMSEFVYNDSSVLVEHIEYLFNPYDSLWEPHTKATYIEESGNTYASIYYRWDDVWEKWARVYKIDYAFDGLGNYIAMEYSARVGSGLFGSWMLVMRDEYEFDYSVSRSALISPYRNLFENKLIENTTYYDYESGLEPGKRYAYHYSTQIIAGGRDVLETSLKVYPNPVTESIVFDCPFPLHNARIEIYDLQGKSLFSSKLSSDNTVSVQRLGQGIYIYKILSNGNSFTGKFMKE